MEKIRKEYENHPLSGNPLAENYQIEFSDIKLQNKSIAIFTIGPVQSFISAAKKTKEFWSGSYLLSYLIWQALEVVIDKASQDNVIFPYLEEQPFYARFKEKKDPRDLENLEMPTLPNRFLAILEQEEAESILEECEDKVKSELLNIFEAEKNYFDFNELGDEEKARQQIEKLLQVYWVALPVTESLAEEIERYQDFKGLDEGSFESQYALATSFAEELLGGRKNLREFSEVEEEGIKCFICGDRSALVVPDYEDNDICGVCSLKRNFNKYYRDKIANESLHYPSVIEIATWDYKEELVKKLSESEMSNLKATFRKEFSDLETVPQLLKEKNYDSLERDLLEITGDYFDLEGEHLAQAPVVSRLLKQYNNKYDLNLNKYYALIYMDGDGMGDWVSGEKIEQTMSPLLHSMISRSLTNYSLKYVKEVVEENGYGKVIYAGGDDVVALVNLTDLCDVMRELSAYFSGSIKDGEIDLTFENGIIRNDLTLGPNASVSLGACIAHYKEPLNLVIDKAQAMESKAKNNLAMGKQKDAFAWGLLKHSGEIREASAKWLYGEVDIIETGIKPLLEMVRNEKLSRSYVYNLKQELENLTGSGLADIVESEMKRIAARKSEDLDKEKLDSVIDNLKLIYENDYSTASEEKTVDNLDNFISLLEIIFFLGKRGE